MKKYILGLFAIVLGVSMSAFTTVRKEHKTTGTVLYWYHVSGSSTVGSTLNPDAPVDKADAMNDLTDCDDQATDICLFGSSNPNLQNANIGTPTAEQRIREKQ